MEIARQHMACQVASFPCKYLSKTLDKIADRLLGWKAALLDKSGRLILVKAVLTSILIYLLIALDPHLVHQVVDKWRRNFLCRGRKEIQGEHYPVDWQRVTRPVHLGGLGIQIFRF